MNKTTYPKCPSCGSTAKRCKRPSGHDAMSWHVARALLTEQDDRALQLGDVVAKGYGDEHSIMRGIVEQLAADQETVNGVLQRAAFVSWSERRGDRISWLGATWENADELQHAFADGVLFDRELTLF